MYFITHPLFCQRFFEIIFILFEKECLFIAVSHIYLEFSFFRLPPQQLFRPLTN